MKFERKLIKGNIVSQFEDEIKPKGILIYSSGFPVDREFMRKTIDRQSYKASVHALVDSTGVTQVVPLDCRAQHSGMKVGNTGYLAVMVCEPISSREDYPALRDLTRRNLVEYLVFLSRYWDIDPMNVSDLIQFAGTAAESKIVSPEVLKSYDTFKSYFGRPVNGGSEDGYEYVDEGSVKTEVKQTLVRLSELYGGVLHRTETSLSKIGVGDVVLFTGGDQYKTRGASTRENFERGMRHGVITDHAPDSRHAFEVAFPDGSVVWVNKGTLVRSTLGHVSR